MPNNHHNSLQPHPEHTLRFIQQSAIVSII